MSRDRPRRFSRRQMVAGLGAAGAATLVPAGARALPESKAQAKPGVVLSAKARAQAEKSLLAYFAKTAPELLRPPQGFLKYPSIAPSLPGKTYSTSLWDWDTYWTARGLFAYAKMTRDAALHKRVCEHAIGSLRNFLKYQSDEGRIPIMISVDQVDLFGSLKPASPNYRNQAKPIFGQLALLAADELKSVKWLGDDFEKILKFHDSWVLGNQSHTGLLVWGDDVAIGNDNDPTTFGRPFFSSANVLLNCLYYEDLKAVAELARRLGRAKDAKRLGDAAAQQGKYMEEFSWDPRDKFYYTVDVQCVDRRAELIPGVKRGMAMSWKCLPLRIQTFTGFLPLWCGVATQEQARMVVEGSYLADDRFRAAYGVRSLSSHETMYELVFSSNPSDWLGPVWIIVNYFTWKALKGYGYENEAAELRDKTLKLLAGDLENHGSLNEYYNPDTGAAMSHAGFMDWNLLVLEMMQG